MFFALLRSHSAASCAVAGSTAPRYMARHRMLNRATAITGCLLGNFEERLDQRRRAAVGEASDEFGRFDARALEFQSLEAHVVAEFRARDDADAEPGGDALADRLSAA